MTLSRFAFEPHVSPLRVGLIGDVHHNQNFVTAAVERLTDPDLLGMDDGVHEVAQVGDWGFADGTEYDAAELRAIDEVLERCNAVMTLVLGNHEALHERREAYPEGPDGRRWLGDRIAVLPRVSRWRAVNGVTIAAVAGANSIDRPFRQQFGRGWSPLESVTEADLAELGDEPATVLLGHDAPVNDALTRTLAPSAGSWSTEGLAYAEQGQRMFSRAHAQVRPAVAIAGHYHVSLTTTQLFTDSKGEEFTGRVEVLAAEWDAGSIAVLDFSDLSVTRAAFKSAKEAYEQIGLLLRARREHLGLTVEDAAHQLAVGVSTVQAIEAGNIRPSRTYMDHFRVLKAADTLRPGDEG